MWKTFLRGFYKSGILILVHQTLSPGYQLGSLKQIAINLLGSRGHANEKAIVVCDGILGRKRLLSSEAFSEGGRIETPEFHYLIRQLANR